MVLPLSEVGAILDIVPGYRQGVRIELVGLTIMGPTAHLVPNGVQMCPHEIQGQLGGNQKLHMMPVHVVNVGRTEEAPVQNYLDLLIAQSVHVRQQFSQWFHVGNVSCQLPVIKWQAGLLPEEQG